MAANFWTSSHCKELLDAEKVGIVHPLDKEQGLTQEDVKIIKIHMSNWWWQQLSHISDVFIPGKRYEIKDVLEMEMKLLEALDYYLVIYHPYRPLIQLLQDAGLNDLNSTAWSLVNDTYKTDLILTYAPYMIALACIYFACILKEKDAHVWFEELRVDMNEIKNISMEIVDYYDNYRNIPDEKTNTALNKLPQRF